VEGLVVTVIVEEAVAGFVLKLAMTSLGNPFAPKVTDSAKPPELVMLTV
jgi:hypothetical protein